MSWVDDLEPIRLEELNEQAALLTRTDRKYIIDAQLAHRLLPRLSAGSMVLEIEGQRGSGYSSVYFDDPQRASYLSAARNRRRRFKIRTRSYLDSGQCFLEVKTEGAREQTVKERIAHPFDQRFELLDSGCQYVRDTLEHGLGHLPVQLQAMAPVLESSYRRTTLFHPASLSRVTLDEELAWLDPGTGRCIGCTQVVLETKAALNAGPVDRLLWRHGVRPARISKFATGLGLLHPQLPANRWHHTIKNRLSLVPAPNQENAR